MKFPHYLIAAFFGGILLASCNNEEGPGPAECNTNPVQITGISTTESQCGINDGTITVTGTGGNGSYLYSIDGNNFQSSNKFENLIAGNYNVTLKDEVECTASAQATIISTIGMEIQTSFDTSGCGTTDGAIYISPSGGAEPYNYKLDNESYQADNTFINLSAGEYMVFVKDNNDCEISSTVKINNGTSLDAAVMPIIETNCAISGCHDGGNNLPDWSLKGNVISYASIIKQRTGSGSMPPMGSSISDEEIDIIACWVDDGAEDN